MYVVYNKFKNPLLSAKQFDPRQQAKMAMIRTGNGVGYIDLDALNFNHTAKPPLIPITNAVVGCNNQIIFSETNKKFVYMKGVNVGL